MDLSQKVEIHDDDAMSLLVSSEYMRAQQPGYREVEMQLRDVS